MPLILQKKEQFKYTVRVRQPDDKGGLSVLEFIGVYKWLEQPAIQEILRTTPRDKQLLDKVWVGWELVKTKVLVDGKEVEQDLAVSDINRQALLAEPGVEVALVNAWLDAVVFGPAKN